MLNAIEGFAKCPIVTASPAAAELEAIKARQRATWASGDYGFIGTTLQIVGESLCEAVDLRAGSKVLDVAAGNGNCSLAAARRWCEVTSTDYVPALLDDGRRRAEADRLQIKFQEADAEALPLADESFDAVLSSFGVMFVPNHVRVATELVRVCRSKGRIGLASWTPGGFIGRLFAVVGRDTKRPRRRCSRCLRDGERTRTRHQLFGSSASSIRTTRLHFVFRYRSAEHWIDVFRTWDGLVHKAFTSLPPESQRCLEEDLIDLINEFNRSGDSTMVVPSEYLEAGDRQKVIQYQG